MATTYTPRPGESIGELVELLVTLAGASRGRVDCEFNGIQFWAEPGESRSLVAARYRELCEAASAAYRNSPEGMGRISELDEVERAAILALEERFDLGNYAATDADIGAAGLWEDQETCLTHMRPEPCSACAAYIAAGC